MRQLHILFNSAKTWHVIVCWFLCFSLNLSELNLKLFWTSEQNNFRFSSGKFMGKHRNQQVITCQVLAELNEIWSCWLSYSLSCTLWLNSIPRGKIAGTSGTCTYAVGLKVRSEMNPPGLSVDANKLAFFSNLLTTICWCRLQYGFGLS